MTGPSMGPRSRCPFAHCSADVMLVIEQATPGDDEATVRRVPQHRIVGEAERFGQCPASLMIIPLDAYSRESLTTQAKAIGLMIKPPVDPPEPREPAAGGGLFPVGRTPRAGEHPLTPHPDPNHPWFAQGVPKGDKRGGGSGGVNVPQYGKAGQGVVPMPDDPHAGPGPGRASKPYQPTAGDIVEKHAPPANRASQQGSTAGMSDNDLRAQLIALTTLAIDGFGQQQEQCSALSGIIESNLASIREALKTKQEATHALALAAVGSRSDVPEAAANMIGASSSVGSTIGEIEQSCALLLGWVAATHAYAASAASNGRAYLAQI